MDSEFLRIKNEMYDLVVNNTKDVTPSNVTPIILEVMKRVEKISGVAGSAKKNLCLNIVYDLISDLPSNKVINKEVTNTIISNSGSMVDVIVEASKGGAVNVSILRKIFELIKKIFMSCSKRK